jgi:hypothetical protein
VDLCIVVSEDPRRPQERIPEYLPARFPVPLDLTVLTEEEFTDLPEHSPEFSRAILGGRRL